MMPTTPTERTLEECRRLGWMPGRTEHFQYSAAYVQVLSALRHGTRKDLYAAISVAKSEGLGIGGWRKDLYGFVDVLAMTGQAVVAIQATVHNSIANRFRKMTKNTEEDDYFDRLRKCLKSGAVVEIWGWKKHAKAMERRFWHPTKLRFMISVDGIISAKFPTGQVRTESEF